MRFQVVNGSQHVILKGCVIEISLAGTRRAAESTEIDCHNAESLGRESVSLNAPTLLVESPSMSKHNRTRASAKEVSAYLPTIAGRKRDALLCRGERRNGDCKAYGSQLQHAGIIHPVNGEAPVRSTNKVK
jgi:hypothetical protein